VARVGRRSKDLAETEAGEFAPVRFSAPNACATSPGFVPGQIAILIDGEHVRLRKPAADLLPRFGGGTTTNLSTTARRGR
jgi:hypothetical protein